tara:strand:+ start:13979 stop:16234 length:2256 start_codon:yes stop_codon:yes gene_type:complete
LTFEQLEPLLHKYPDRGFGFVLTEGDGFTCIDLDTKEDTPISQSASNHKLMEDLASYTEVSRSGNGLHIWLKGEIRGAIKTATIEVYSKERFIICTGNVIVDKPMVYDQSVIEFFNERASEAVDYDLADGEQKLSDEEVIAKCYEHDHSGKFKCLMDGDWATYCEIMNKQLGVSEYEFDASQADSAFMTIVNYFTPNVEQCKRLWWNSALGDITRRYPGNFKEQHRKQRNHGSEYKLKRALGFAQAKNARDREEREHQNKVEQQKAAAVLSQFNPERQKEAEKLIEDAERVKADQLLGESSHVSDIDYPPGMLGELARYFYGQSLKPIKEFAIAEALAVASGLFGRCYNISGTGLNNYFMVLAPSGTGKSALSRNPEALMTMLERHKGIVGARNFIMTKRFTHENAMFNEFQTRTSFCQCLSEFGKIFKNMVSVDNQGGALATVREQMTDVYSKSGQYDVVGGLRYSKNENSIDINHSVAFSFLGESVPEPFFQSITRDMFTDGFISRFMLLRYDGDIPYDTAYNAVLPPEHLLNHLEQATLGVTRALMDPNYVDTVPIMQDDYSSKFFADFSRKCTDEANATKGEDDIVNSLWTRANLKLMKVCGLIAAMDCPSQPVITKEHVDWGLQLLRHHHSIVRSAVTNGEIADGTENEAMETLREIMIGFFNVSNPQNYGSRAGDMHTNRHIPWNYISNRATRRAIFKDTRYKRSIQVIRETIEELKRAGKVVQLDPKKVMDMYHTRGDVFMVVE